MSLLSRMAPRGGTRAGAAFAGIWRRAAILLSCATCGLAGHAAHAAGGVYIAGQGMSLEQAFEQALAENRGAAKQAFWIVAAGDEGVRLAGAGGSLSATLKKVRERGGVVYVCRADLMRKGIKEESLPDGVASVYGYGSQEWAGLLPARKEGLALPDNLQQTQLILRTCAGEGANGKT